MFCEKQKSKQTKFARLLLASSPSFTGMPSASDGNPAAKIHLKTYIQACLVFCEKQKSRQTKFARHFLASSTPSTGIPSASEDNPVAKTILKLLFKHICVKSIERSSKTFTCFSSPSSGMRNKVKQSCYRINILICRLRGNLS